MKGRTAIGKLEVNRASVTFRTRLNKLFAIKPQKPPFIAMKYDPCAKNFLWGERGEIRLEFSATVW